MGDKRTLFFTNKYFVWLRLRTTEVFGFVQLMFEKAHGDPLVDVSIIAQTSSTQLDLLEPEFGPTK